MFARLESFLRRFKRQKSPAKMTSEKSNNSLHPGGAATSIKQDVLNRGAFVRNLAASIKKYTGGDSLTIGLYGPWGCGKSSLLNFIIEELEPDKERIAVARFNPWNFSQQDRLFSSFFTTMSSLIKRSDDSKDAKKVASWLDTIAAVTSPVSVVGLGFIPKAAEKLAKAFTEFSEEWGDSESVKRDISKILGESKKRYVIVIDDIDRLTHGEVRQVFQLVKSMADFKNVVYVLAFDHEMVAKALDRDTDGDGHAYLEKVINVPIMVPQLTARQVRRLFVAELNAYAERQRDYNWNNERMDGIVEIAVRSFKTIRQIERFSNALVILEGLTKRDVDFTDHIALTMLKALEPTVHDFVGSHPELFVDDVLNQLGRRDEQDATEMAVVEKALEKLESLTHDDAVGLLEAVFPKITRVYASYGKSKQWGKGTWRLESRACADYKTFMRYFAFQVDEGDISGEDRDKLWEACTDVGKLEAYFAGIDNVERLHRTLEYLGDLNDGQISGDQISIIVTAVMDVGDSFSELPGLADVFFGPFNEAISSCNTLLKMLPLEQRFDVTLSALKRPPKSIEMPAVFVSRIADLKNGVFTEDQRNELSAEVADLLKAAWLDGRLIDGKRRLYLVSEWFRLSPEDAKAIVRATLEFDDGAFLKFASLYENVQAGDYHPHRFYYSGLFAFYSLEEQRERLQHIAQDENMSAEHGRIAAMLAEVEKGIKALQTKTAAEEGEEGQGGADSGGNLPIAET